MPNVQWQCWHNSNYVDHEVFWTEKNEKQKCGDWEGIGWLYQGFLSKSNMKKTIVPWLGVFIQLTYSPSHDHDCMSWFTCNMVLQWYCIHEMFHVMVTSRISWVVQLPSISKVLSNSTNLHADKAQKMINDRKNLEISHKMTLKNFVACFAD